MKKAVKATTAADRLLLVFLLIFSVSGFFLAKEAMPESPGVVIEVDGKPAFSTSLEQDRVIELENSFGRFRVEIKDRKVRVAEAHCPGRLCEKQGWISKGVLVCLPARIVVYVGGGEPGSGSGLDAVTG